MNEQRAEAGGLRPGNRLSTEERIVRILGATPDQRAAIDRILAGEIEERIQRSVALQP